MFEAASRARWRAPPQAACTGFIGSLLSLKEDWAETWAHYLHMTDMLEPPKAPVVPAELTWQGYYSCRGTLQSGKPYSGIVSIKKFDENLGCQF